MKGKLKKDGKYELFKTTEDHQILTLDDEKFYAVVEGQKGDIIVHSNSDHQKKKTVSKGHYYYADFDDDPEFKDMAHLFMEDGSKYREFILPEGFPSKKDHQKKLVRPGEKLSKKKVEEHVKGDGGEGKNKKGNKDSNDLNEKTKGELYEMAKKQNLEGRSKMDKKELIKNLQK